jgi:hypothetical protein
MLCSLSRAAVFQNGFHTREKKKNTAALRCFSGTI